MKPSSIGLLGILGILAVGCTLPFEEVEALDIHFGPQKAPRRSCDTLTEAEMRRAAEAAEAALGMVDLTLAEAWSDTAAFAVFAGAAARFAGCTDETTGPDGSVEVGLHSGKGSTYCGIGQSNLSVDVSTCLNEACREHDTCYARCSSATSATCMWGGPTEPCDRQFLQALDCDDDSRLFRSDLVRSLAVGLHALGGLGASTSMCPEDMVCPGADEKTHSAPILPTGPGAWP